MICFTFPGQGSQKPGMGAPWRDHESWELVVEASELAGRDLAHLLLAADADELVQTRNSQLATFALSLVVLDAIERIGVEPARLAGHSLGEYTALVAAGALSFEDGVALVAERGEAMQDAAEQRAGTMAAVLGLDDDQVETACRATTGDVWVANYNAPGQVVIAGDPAAIEACIPIAENLGAKRVLPLPVGGAFHTPLMAPARDRLEKAIAAADLRDATVPVLANVDGEPYREAATWRGLLAEQLVQPVRWRRILHHLADDGVTTLLEVGPGNVLTGMAKRTTKHTRQLAINRPEQLDDLLEVLHQPSTEGRSDEGEALHMAERLVVSPAAGVFRPMDIEVGSRLSPGDLVGVVGEHEVRSPFPGDLMGLLAVAGERVMASQPIAWLRTA